MSHKIFWSLVIFLLPLAAAQNQKLEIVKIADGGYAAIYSE